MKLINLVAGSAAIALAVGAAAQSRQAGGTTTYWMSAETQSGLGATAAAAQNSRAGMVGAMLSGRAASGPSAVRNLTLQLSSPRRPSGAPNADHLPPPGLGAGPALPLVTPAPTAAPQTNYTPGNVEGARGRILIYWGCGERARAGQPYEIDLAKLSRGQAQAIAGLAFQSMAPPSAGRAGTYGDWPNQRSRTSIPATGSLVGDHKVVGNYSPEIRFALASGQDFLAPVVVTSNEKAASGAVPVSWRAVPNALGYYMMATGAREDGTIVMWSSSEVQLAQMGLFDYLAPAEVSRLIQRKAIMSPQTTQCTVPAEVGGGVQAATLMLNAFGPEANFSHPVRPANAGRNWTPEWTVKLRTRAAYTGMLGMDMERMMRGGDDDSREGRQGEPSRRRRNPLNPLKRILGQ